MSISFSEIIVIFLVALVLFGPEQLPVLARSIGKIVGELKRGSDSVRREFYNSVYKPADEVRRDLSIDNRALRALKAEIMAPPIGSAPTNHRALQVPEPEPETKPQAPSDSAPSALESPTIQTETK